MTRRGIASLLDKQLHDGRRLPPPHLIVIGGSYVGLEFAQIFRRFGSEVTVIELAPRLIAREDEDVSEAVATILKREGIDVRVDAKCASVARLGSDTILNHCSDRNRTDRYDARHGRRRNRGCLNREELS